MPAEAHDKTCESRKTGEREVFDHEEESFVDVEDRDSCLEHGERQITVDVRDGEESYTEQEQVGKSCKSHGFETNGGVAVKKCLEWEPKYQEVTKTRPKYRQEQQTVRECVRHGTKKERRTEDLPHRAGDRGVLPLSDRRLEDDAHAREGRHRRRPAVARAAELTKSERVGDRKTSYVVIFKALRDTKSAHEKNQKRHACEPEPCEHPFDYEEWRKIPIGKIQRVATRFRYIERYLNEGEKL